MRRWREALGLMALAAAGACELPEVPAPDSEDILVVEAVLRAGTPRQYILLHRTVEGHVVRGESAAAVTVTDSQGRVFRYDESGLRPCVLGSVENWEAALEAELGASCYVTPPDEQFVVEPGETYRLEIVTAAGERAQGQTTVPETYAFTSPRVDVDDSNLTVRCILPAAPFTLAWERAEGAWAYVVSMRIMGLGGLLPEEVEVPEPLELTSVSVSAADTSLLFPAHIGLFQRGELDGRIFELLQQGIPQGVTTMLVVVATDRNYANAVRGGRFNPSGTTRVSSVAGDAVGVFGSIVPLTLESVPAPNFFPGCPTPLPPGAGG